jgi:hypothetical protein
VFIELLHFDPTHRYSDDPTTGHQIDLMQLRGNTCNLADGRLTIASLHQLRGHYPTWDDGIATILREFDRWGWCPEQ